MQLLRVTFSGHLTAHEVTVALRDIERKAEGDAAMLLVVDCSEMSGYDAEARARFVDWHRATRDRIGAVGVVTENLLWPMVVRAMSMASGVEMRAFDRVDAAEDWLRARPPVAPRTA